MPIVRLAQRWFSPEDGMHLHLSRVNDSAALPVQRLHQLRACSVQAVASSAAGPQ